MLEADIGAWPVGVPAVFRRKAGILRQMQPKWLTKREMQGIMMKDWAKALLRGLAIVGGIAFIFAWFGVYNTDRMGFLPRFAFWCATIIVGYGTSYFATPFVRTQLKDWPIYIRLPLLAALVSIPITILVMFILSDRVSVPGFAMQFLYVFVVSLVLTVLSWTFSTLNERTIAAQTIADPTLRFLERLPVKYRTADLYAVSSEDHYLRVHTSMGEELILMRLVDACHDLADADGLRTHRSWWVARAGVADTAYIDGKLALVLKSGAHAGVSRTYAPAVKAAGLS